MRGEGEDARDLVAEVWIPRRLQGLTLGQAQVQAAGATVRQVIHSLENTYPGIIDFLCDENGIAPNMAVVVDGETSYLGLLEKVQENSEIHFLPAIGGGLGRHCGVIR
jgi:molybdopterin synthase sulfur carrier subunit